MQTDSDDERSVGSAHSLDTEYNEFEPYSEVDSDYDLQSFTSDSDLEIVSIVELLHLISSSQPT